MTQEELKKLYKDISISYDENIDQYRRIMLEILPDYINLTWQERMLKDSKFDDEFNEFSVKLKEDFIKEGLEREPQDYNNPTESYMDIVYDYIYGDNKDLTKEEKVFMKDFNNICEAKGILEYILDIKKAKNEYDKMYYDNIYLDTDILTCNNEDIIITDPCYVNSENYGKAKKIEHISRDTLYGDWSCTVYNTDTKEILGHFTADGGMVAVFKLNDVKEHYPEYDHIEKYPHTVTVIRGFTGTVQIKVKHSIKTGFVCYVEGKGNINFISTQTGF